jgi:hypothetical protein
MGNGQNFPFQINDLDQPAAEPLGYPTVRTQVEAECPGSFEKTVVLLRGRQVLDGLKEPRNIGSCTIHIACYDKTGTFIGTYHLAPGEKMSFLTFPSNTEVVRMGCDKGCSGTAILEYQTPYIA